MKGQANDRTRAIPHRVPRLRRANIAHFGHDWIMFANPEYGSFESAPFKGDYKLSEDQRRQMKTGALQAWSGPPQ